MKPDKFLPSGGPAGRGSRKHFARKVQVAVGVLGTGLLRQCGAESGKVGADALAALLRAAVVTAHRLLFIIYASGYNLIPQNGLKAGIAEAIGARDEEKHGDIFSTTSFRLWEDLEVSCRQMGWPLNEYAPGLKVSDYFLARAIGLLAGSSEELKDDGRRREPHPSVVDICRLGDAYESILECAPEAGGNEMVLVRRSRRSRRKLSGSYYTPDYIVRYMIEQVLGPLVRGEGGSRRGASKPLTSGEILNLRVLDPAMGSGRFLLAAADYLARAHAGALRREGLIRGSTSGGHREPARSRKLVAERCIYGVDIDPVAVELARLALWLFAAERGRPQALGGEHLKRGNSLLGAAFGEDKEYYENLVTAGAAYMVGLEPRPEGDPFHWDIEFPEIAFHEDGSRRSDPGFDAVAGNPPYLSLSGRQKAAGGEWMVGLSGRYGIGKGWDTSHGLFMVRAAHLAKDSGFVSMIVPDQVGHLKGYEGVRARMLEEGRLIQVRYWGENVFEDATTPVLTFVLERPGPASGYDTVAIDHDGAGAKFSPRAGDEWSATPLRRAYERMLGQHRTLDGFGDPGVHTGNVARKLILTRPTRGALPVIEGRQVHPFTCDRPKRWLDMSYKGQGGEYFRISPRHVYEDTDILIRQTASKPIAARHVFRCHFRNSVLALRVPGGFSVEYVLGILNSEAAAFLYRAASLESRQRAFPQVKVRQLRNLPIPDPRLDENRAVATRIEEIVRGLEARGSSVDVDEPAMRELNGLVWELYGLGSGTES